MRERGGLFWVTAALSLPLCLMGCGCGSHPGPGGEPSARARTEPAPGAQGADPEARRTLVFDHLLEATPAQLAWSPDGSLLALLDEEGRGLVLDAETGEVRAHKQLFERQSDRAIRFDASGQRLLIASESAPRGYVVWDLRRDALDTHPLSPDSLLHLKRLAWSPDGTRLLHLQPFTNMRGALRVLDVSTGRVIRELEIPLYGGWETWVHWPVPDRVTLSGLFGMEVRAADTLELRAQVGGLGPGFYGAPIFSPSGAFMAYRLEDRGIAVRDGETAVVTAAQSAGQIRSHWFLAEATLAYQTDDTIQIVDAGTGRALQTIELPITEAAAVGVSADGTRLYLAGHHGSLSTLMLSTGDRRRLQGDDTRAGRLAPLLEVAPGGDRIAVTTGERLRVIDPTVPDADTAPGAPSGQAGTLHVQPPRVEVLFRRPSPEVTPIVIGVDARAGRAIVGGGWSDGYVGVETLDLIDFRAGELVQRLDVPADSEVTLDFRRLGGIQAGLRTIADLSEPMGIDRYLWVAPDGQHLLYPQARRGSMDGFDVALATRAGRPRGRFPNERDVLAIRNAAFSPDSTRVALSAMSRELDRRALFVATVADKSAVRVDAVSAPAAFQWIDDQTLNVAAERGDEICMYRVSLSPQSAQELWCYPSGRARFFSLSPEPSGETTVLCCPQRYLWFRTGTGEVLADLPLHGFQNRPVILSGPWLVDTMLVNVTGGGFLAGLEVIDLSRGRRATFVAEETGGTIVSVARGEHEGREVVLGARWPPRQTQDRAIELVRLDFSAVFGSR